MKNSKTALLIDDEFSALEMLSIKLNKLFPEINIVGKFQNPMEALEKLPDFNPDILFLDITMPNMSGFDFLSVANLPDTEIIFITAHNDYALEAIRHCAIGYVIKPIDEEKLSEAVRNAIRNLAKKSSLEKTRELLQSLQNNQHSRLVVPTQKGLSILKIQDIVRLEGMDGYTKICLSDKTCIVSSYNIGKFKELLTDNRFIHLHKSHTINADYLKSLLNDGYAELTTGDTIPFSKNKKNEILITLQNTHKNLRS